MLKTAALVLASIPLALAALLASSSCVVVDVKTADGPRIFVPVPLFVAKTALGFAPQEAKHVEIPELAEYSELAAKLIDELRSAGDGILVEVDDRRDHVLIEKIGDELAIDVRSDEEEVSVRLPLSVAAEVLDAYDGKTLEVAHVLEALASVSRTDLVHVRTAEEEVKVWIW
jgi:hypothetical protein